MVHLNMVLVFEHSLHFCLAIVACILLEIFSSFLYGQKLLWTLPHFLFSLYDFSCFLGTLISLLDFSSTFLQNLDTIFPSFQLVFLGGGGGGGIPFYCAVLYSTVQYSIIQYSIIKYQSYIILVGWENGDIGGGGIQFYCAVLYSTVQYSTVQ